jgi:hypothetical protein
MVVARQPRQPERTQLVARAETVIHLAGSVLGRQSEVGLEQGLRRAIAARWRPLAQASDAPADTGSMDWLMLIAVALAFGGVVIGFMEDIDRIRRDAERG